MIGALIGGAAMGGLGYLQGERQRNQQRAYNQAQAEMTKYSPWTGIRGEVKQVTADPWNSALQGATSGALFGSQFGGAPKADTLATGSGTLQSANAYKPQSIYDQMGKQPFTFTA